MKVELRCRYLSSDHLTRQSIFFSVVFAISKSIGVEDDVGAHGL
jgi:hypothetical protein